MEDIPFELIFLFIVILIVIIVIIVIIGISIIQPYIILDNCKMLSDKYKLDYEHCITNRDIYNEAWNNYQKELIIEVIRNNS